MIPQATENLPKRHKIQVIDLTSSDSDNDHDPEPAEPPITARVPESMDTLALNISPVGSQQQEVNNRGQIRKSDAMLPQTVSALTTNFEAGNCQFCCIDLKIGDGVHIENCFHLFCRDCLQSTIEMQTSLVTIPCPISEERKCGGALSDGEVKALVSAAVYQEYIDRSLVIARKKMKNIFTCKTEGCAGFCEFEQGRKTFDCPLCDQTNCVACEAIHAPLNCDEYKGYVTRGQLSKAQELVKKQQNNGWGQLLKNIEALKTQNSTKNDALDEILKAGYVSTHSDFECPICLSDVMAGDGVILQDCLHMFCKECIINLVDLNDDATVKCPFIDGNYSCVSHLNPSEIKALVPADVYEKHLMRSVKLGESSMENSFHCKTPDCTGWCVYDDDNDVEKFVCPICLKSNCIPCNAQHEGTCEDYKNSIEQNKNDQLSTEALEKLIIQGTYMRCPKCKIPVQKTQGCDWLLCPACRTEICWITRGPRWGPKGHGDTSGGCRCRLNGKLCHPKCGNCH